MKGTSSFVDFQSSRVAYSYLPDVQIVLRGDILLSASSICVSPTCCRWMLDLTCTSARGIDERWQGLDVQGITCTALTSQWALHNNQAKVGPSAAGRREGGFYPLHWWWWWKAAAPTGHQSLPILLTSILPGPPSHAQISTTE